MLDTYLEAFVLLLRNRQNLYPNAYNQKTDVMCLYFYMSKQLLHIYTTKYQPDIMAIAPRPFFPMNAIKWLEDLIQTYASGDGSRYSLWHEVDWATYYIRYIEYILSGQKITFCNFDVSY
ncbi:hypothetical protein ACOSP7_009985 [Xanthoceras sorbifolium]